jgi:hypothetical protein
MTDRAGRIGVMLADFQGYRPVLSHRLHLTIRTSVCAATSWSVMLPAIYGTTFPLGRRTTGCSGVGAQPAIHRA